jgi:hypothetical protein
LGGFLKDLLGGYARDELSVASGVTVGEVLDRGE